MNRIAPLLVSVLLLALLLPSCASTSARLESLYDDDIHDARSRDLDIATRQERAQERAEKVREWIADGEIESPADQYHAATILYQSSELEDLDVAFDLALSSFEGGVDDGVRIAAHCIDKMHVKRGLPQRFGTQFEYIAVISQWRLCDIDPKTTDEERAAFGIAPLEELRKREQKLNQ